MLHGQLCTKTAHGLIVSCCVQCWVSAFIFTLLGNWDKAIASVSSVIHRRLLSKQYGYKTIPYGSGGKGATEEDKTHTLVWRTFFPKPVWTTERIRSIASCYIQQPLTAFMVHG